MKDLKIENGDLVLDQQDMRFVSGNDLIIQKVKLLIGTMKGEWFLDEEQGIDRELIYVKEPDEDMIQDAVYQVLLRVDDTFEMDNFSVDLSKNRTLSIEFAAHNSSGEAIKISYEE